MQLKSLILGFFTALSVSCGSTQHTKISCDFESLYLKGVQDGEEGLDYSNSLKTICTKKNKTFAQKTYEKGQKVGLKNFCTLERGQTRALMNLDSEPTCSDYKSYTDGFNLSIETHCSKDLAIIDGQSLTPSNLNCLKNSDYKKTFYNEVANVCNKKLAYQQGFRNLPLSSYCLKLENKQDLLTSYNLGLHNGLKTEASDLEAKARKLSKKLKILKEIDPVNESQKALINKRIDKVTKDYLDTKHSLEQKKAKL